MQTILTSFTLGLLATASPCILPLYPGFLAYLSGAQVSRRWVRSLLGFFVLLGVMSMMLILGGLIALLSISIGRALAIFIPLADLLILGVGVLLLTGHNPFKQLPQLRVPGLSHPLANAYVYGLMYGPIALPCSGPLVVSIFALSLTAGEALNKLYIFFWFGLGFGFPLLILSLLSASLQRRITRFMATRFTLANRLGGILLVGLAVYDFCSNLDLIRLNFP